MTSIYCHFLPRTAIKGGMFVPLVTRSEVTVSSDNSSKMWPARPEPRVENDKSPDTNYFVGGHQAGQARLNIPENTQRWQISQNMIITESVHKIIYHLIFWETDGRTGMPGLGFWVGPTVVRVGGWVIAPSVGQLGHRAVRVTWAMADTVIIINATQCRAFSHLQLRSKSPGQLDTKNSFDHRTSDICGRDLMEPLSVQSFYRQPSICHYKLRITCSVTPQINYYWILMFPHGVN